MESPDLKEMQEFIDRANMFFEDVMPQIGGLCIQDYGNLNELGILLSKLKSKTKEDSNGTKKENSTGKN